MDGDGEVGLGLPIPDAPIPTNSLKRVTIDELRTRKRDATTRRRKREAASDGIESGEDMEFALAVNPLNSSKRRAVPTSTENPFADNEYFNMDVDESSRDSLVSERSVSNHSRFNAGFSPAQSPPLSPQSDAEGLGQPLGARGIERPDRVQQRQRPIYTKRIDGCFMCECANISLPSYDLKIVQSATKDWIHLQLVNNEYFSIWAELVMLSDHFRSIAKKNGIYIAPMSSRGWEHHYLRETRDQFVITARHQINIGLLIDTAVDDITIENPNYIPGQPAFVLDSDRLRQTSELMKLHTRYAETVIKMSKAFMSSAGTTTAQGIRKKVVEFVCSQARIQ